MMVHGRRVSALTAVCSLLILGFGVAGVAQAATQIVTPAIGTVQAQCLPASSTATVCLA